jgi:putative membrane protein
MSDVNGADRRFYAFNAVVSVVALGFLAWLLLLRTADAGGGTVDVRFLPAVNACFNALSALLLAIGFVFIRQKKPHLHKYCMVAAFASSGLFLVTYVTYHYIHGDTKFTGEGPIRAAYLIILLTHVLLSLVIVPGALAAFWFAGTRRFTTHKKITRLLLPAWLYVSVTGVVIFFLLRSYGQSAA